MSEEEEYTRYCVRCDSEEGWDEEHPNFCTVCWEPRMPLPKTVLLHLRARKIKIAKLQKEVDRLKSLNMGWKQAAERWKRSYAKKFAEKHVEERKASTITLDLSKVENE